jgi:hypothetical protein
MLDHIIAWAALLFSGIALLVAIRTQRRQPELITKQISAMDREARGQLKAQVVAQLNRSSAWSGAGGRYMIHVRNDGPAEAREIDIRFPNDDSPVPADEARAKLPVPVLQAGGSFELIAAVSFDNPPPFSIVLSWRDGLGAQERETTLS